MNNEFELQTQATVKPEVVFIEDLLDEVQSGQLRVPRFQRPFVWSPEDMRQLFDSIYKGYPIGSLLIWETSENLASLDLIGPFAISEAQGRPVSYILDGHQRLTTLLTGLRLPANAKRSKEQEHWKWWLFFDLEKKEFVHDPNCTHDPKLFPLRALLKTVDFLSQSRQIQQALIPSIAEEYIHDAESIAQKIKAYKVPVTRIRGGKLNDAVAIFSRLNSLGMGMTADQMISALTYQEGAGAINLAEEIDSVLVELGEYNFGEIHRKLILQVVLIAAGLDLKMGDWEDIALDLKTNIANAINEARGAAINAARFLHEKAGVPDSSYLPYANQFIILATFFVKCPAPDQEQEKILLRWFWSTALGGWFAGANPSQFRNGVEEMKNFAKNRSASFQVMPLDETARPLPSEFNSRSARVRCMLIFLFLRHPLIPSTLQPLPADEVQGENRGLSYVFTGVERRLLAHPANRILLHRQRGITVREQIMNVADGDRQRFLSSHCINEAAFEALVAGDAERFISQRKKFIQQEETAFFATFGLKTLPTTVDLSADDDAEN